jgi:hypothetical protein
MPKIGVYGIKVRLSCAEVGLPPANSINLETSKFPGKTKYFLNANLIVDGTKKATLFSERQWMQF